MFLLLWDPEQKGSCLFYGSAGLVEGEGERVRSRKVLSQSGENMLVKAPGNEVLWRCLRSASVKASDKEALNRDARLDVCMQV